MTSPSLGQPTVVRNRPHRPSQITLSSGIRIHYILTGYVAVKRAHWEYRGLDGTGILAILGGRSFTEWVPITAWLIEHPEGNLLVDTGETHRSIADPDYFNCDTITGSFYRNNLRFDLLAEEEILPQLAQIGVATNSIRWVIQTHLHSDHMGGLPGFPRATVYVPRADYPASTGALPCRYPSWLDPRFPSFGPCKLAGFSQAFPLTEARDIWVVPTPGHSEGHQSVLLRDGEHTYFFAGDASFTQKQLLDGRTQGIAASPRTQRQTLGAIREYARRYPTVYLPTHDPESRRRFLERETVPRTSL